MPIALNNIGCQVKTLFMSMCNLKDDRCDHDNDVCLTCETCPLSDLPDIPNSNTEVIGTKFQDVVAFPCLDGYEYPDGSQNQTVTCDWDQTWTDPDFAACQNIDECASNPCVNGHCVDGIAEYSCNCNTGYTGCTCEMDIDDCASDPCTVNSMCEDGIAEYSCICNAGYTGSSCEIDIDDCDPNPCGINSLCEDGIADYTCMCDPGYVYQCTPENPDAISITADNEYHLYVDGQYVGTNDELKEPQTYQLIMPPKVIAVVGIAQTGHRGIILSTDSGIKTDETWKCKALDDVTSNTDWVLESFDDSMWNFAATYGVKETSPWKNKLSQSQLNENAQWIWENPRKTAKGKGQSKGKTADNRQVVCRKRF